MSQSIELMYIYSDQPGEPSNGRELKAGGLCASSVASAYISVISKVVKIASYGQLTTEQLNN